MEGNALVRKEQYLNARTNPVDNEIYLGTYDGFISTLKLDFKDVDAKATAIYDLGRITQEATSIETHNAKFSLLVSKSGLSIAATQDLLTDYYQWSLNIKKCWTKYPVPTTYENGWMQHKKWTQRNDNSIASNVSDQPTVNIGTNLVPLHESFSTDEELKRNQPERVSETSKLTTAT